MKRLRPAALWLALAALGAALVYLQLAALLPALRFW